MATIAVVILGFGAGVEYDLMAYLVSRYSGMKNYAVIYGCLYGFFAMGAGSALILWDYLLLKQEEHYVVCYVCFYYRCYSIIVSRKISRV